MSDPSQLLALANEKLGIRPRVTLGPLQSRGRVRRGNSGRWVAEHGQGGALYALGECDTPELAEQRVQQAILDARERLAVQYDLPGYDYVARQVREMLDGLPMNIDVWATTGDRLRAGELAKMRMVGLAEIADWLGVARQSADNWRQRGVMPEPDATVGGRPAWRRETIEVWARETGRLKD